MREQLFAYTGRVSPGSGWAPVLTQHGIREMTNRGQTPARPTFALDNGAYIDWRHGDPFDEPAYLRTLKACIPLKPDFVIIPDKVAGGLESLAFSLSWIPRLRSMMPNFIPLALAVQDGMEPQDIEPYLGQFDILFLGGSRPWKYRTGEQWCRWANQKGIPVHIGAIGSMVGVRWAKAIDATSIDSTSPLWSKIAMKNWLKALEETYSQAEWIIKPPPIRPQRAMPKISRKRPPSRDDISGIEDTMRQEMEYVVIHLVNFTLQKRAEFMAKIFEKMNPIILAVQPSNDSLSRLILYLKMVAENKDTTSAIERMNAALLKDREQLRSRQTTQHGHPPLQAAIAVAKAAELISSRFDQKNIIQATHLIGLAAGYASPHATNYMPDQDEILATIRWMRALSVQIKAKTSSTAPPHPSAPRNTYSPPPRQQYSAPPPYQRAAPVKIKGMSESQAKDLLGLGNDLSEAAIKSAFRKKALEHHPDRGGSKDVFQEVRSAYEFLMQKNFGRVAGASAKPVKKKTRVGQTLSEAQRFHDQMMGNVQFDELTEIRRQFGEAHLRGVISDSEFIELEDVARSIYELLRLETASLPPFTIRTTGSQDTLRQWIYTLQNTRTVEEFKRSWRAVEADYKSGKISRFDVMTLQPIAKPLFDEMFHKDWPGTFGFIVDPSAKVAGVAKKSKNHRVGAMRPDTEFFVDLWKKERNIDWSGASHGSASYYAMIPRLKLVAVDPEAPTEFLDWLYQQHKRAKRLLPASAIHDAPFDYELLANPNTNAILALHIAGDIGASTHVKPARIMALLENPGLSLYLLEDPSYLEKIFGLIQKIHPIEIPSALKYFQETAMFNQWLGAQVQEFTFNRAHRRKDLQSSLSPYPLPKSVIVYQGGVTDVIYWTDKAAKENPRFYRSLDELKKRLGEKFLSLSDQQMPPPEKSKKAPKGKVGGKVRATHVAHVSRVGAISSSTQVLLDQWKNGEKFDPFQMPIDPDKGQGEQIDAKIKEAASSPEVPSAFLLWLLDSHGMWNRELVMKNPNLSLDDAFIALDERKFRNHWRREKSSLYIQLPAALWLLDNFSFQLFLMENPAVYERLFAEVQQMGKVKNKDVYRGHVDDFLSHPVMIPWLGESKTYTFTRAKRDKSNDDRAMFPLAVTVFDNGVIRVEHTLSERKERTPLFRRLEEYLDTPAWSSNYDRPLTPEEFLAMSDQMSAKRKAK